MPMGKGFSSLKGHARQGEIFMATSGPEQMSLFVAADAVAASADLPEYGLAANQDAAFVLPRNIEESESALSEPFMPYTADIREEELKNRVARDFFAKFDAAKIIGNIDFCIADKNNPDISYLWAEAKKGAANNNIYDSLVQLILTIGKERTFDAHLPPQFLGAFDTARIAFLPYHLIMDVFARSDFNWKVRPSDHASAEFTKLKELVLSTLEKGLIVLSYDEDLREIRKFIKENFSGSVGLQKIEINRNNFAYIFYKWLEVVKPTINAKWEQLNAIGVWDADFYLADVFSQDNMTLKEKLSVLLKQDRYEFERIFDEYMGIQRRSYVSFKDGQKAHTQFWNIYERPPKEVFQDFIVQRRDLLVPQDVRERKGSYFTPQIWVELSQKYLAKELGPDWQDEYYIWDCAAGTGNLLTGLTDKYKIWASTLDQSDVDIMKERAANGANLLEDHIFQFDFLNDDFSKLPEMLREYLKDDLKRRKLLIYINPPYAEAASRRTISSRVNKNKTNVTVANRTYPLYREKLGLAGRELYVQFLARIYKEIPQCKIAHFSKLKTLQAPNFKKFRQFFPADLRKLFIVPSFTFDNVDGQFPIGFFIYNTAIAKPFKSIKADIYDANGNFAGKKAIRNIDAKKTINDWLIATRKRGEEKTIGFLSAKGCDFQNQNYIYIVNAKSLLPHPRGTVITDKNLREVAIYYAVRKVIKASWLNDRDQFLHPKNTWMEDTEFQNNCLIYTIFNANIKSEHGPNYWLPFAEAEIDARDAFSEHFMHNYINGKLRNGKNLNGDTHYLPTKKLKFAKNARLALDAAKNIWRYYNRQNSKADPNAALYDIKAYFQTSDLTTGKMANFSEDEEYNKLMAVFRHSMRQLALDIIPKVYEHGFLQV